MITNTPNPATGASAGEAPEFPSVGFQEPDHLRSVTTNIEADFLLDAFGVTIPRRVGAGVDLPQLLTEQIVSRVIPIMDTTRRSIERAGLRRLLQENLQNALASIDIRSEEPHRLRVLNPLQERRTRAVMDAIRLSLPETLINDVIRYGLPSFIPADVTKQSHIIALDKVNIESECDFNNPGLAPAGSPPLGECKVEIDTRNEFWRKEYKRDPTQAPPQNELRERLIQELIDNKRTLNSLGIRILRRPPVAEDFRITKEADIDTILKTTSNGIDLSRSYDVIQFHSAAQPGIRFTVDTAKLIRHRDSSGNLFAQKNVNQFRAALVANENSVQNFITVEPYGTPVQNSAWQQLAMHIFDEIGRPGKSLALASRSVDMIQRQVGEQHRFFEQFREGSDNHWGAAMSTMAVMKHKDLRDTISAGNDTEVRNSLLTEERRKRLLAAITQTRTLTYTPIFSWQVADQTRTNLPAAMAVIPLGGPMPPLGGQAYNVPTPPTAEDRRQAIAWANERMREANQVIAESQRVATNFVTIGTIIRELHPGSALPVLTYVDWTLTPPSVPPAFFALYDRNLNLSVLLDAVVSDTNLQLKTEQLHQTQIDTLNVSLKKIADGEVPKGADAQFKVLSAELIRYHGLTEDEARSGANVLRARSLIDTDMSQVADRIVERMYGEHDHSVMASAGESLLRLDLGGRDAETIRQIALACHIPASRDRRPLWSQCEYYEDLITAYFALRKLKRQKFYDRSSDVPWDLRIRDGAHLDAEMAEIAKALLLQHSKGLLERYGPSVNLKDGDKDKILADPLKPEHQRILQQILQGNPDASTVSNVSHAIEHASKRIHPTSRMISNSLFGKDWGAVTGARNPLSMRGVLYGNKNASAVGAGKGIAAGAKFGWQRKWGVAAGATLGFVALGPLAPVGILAGGILGGKFLLKPKGGSTPH